MAFFLAGFIFCSHRLILKLCSCPKLLLCFILLSSPSGRIPGRWRSDTHRSRRANPLRA